MIIIKNGMTKEENLEVVTSLMGELVEPELTATDRAAIAELDADTNQKNKKYRAGGIGLLGAIGYGTYKLVKHYDVVLNAVQNFTNSDQYDILPELLIGGIGISIGVVGFIYAVHMMSNPWYNDDAKRKIYMKYPSARNFMMGQTAQRGK